MSDERSERERRVVASLIDPSTRAAAEDTTKRHGLTERHFSNAQWRDNFEVLAKSGADVFKGKLGGGPACDVSIDDPDELEAAVRRIVADYQPPSCSDAADLLAEPDDPDDPLIYGIVERGAFVAIVGPAKAAKSHLAEKIAVHIATGRDIFNRQTKRQRVYCANIEVSRKRYKKRLRAICAASDIRPEDLRGWLAIDNLRGKEATWDYCLAEARRRKAEVVIIDPFYRIFKGKETDEGDCILAVEEMSKFLAAGFSLFVVFHAPKGYSGDRQIVDMISGSSVLVRFPENVIAILPHATEKTARVVDCSILRDYPPPNQFTVKFENGTLVMAPDIEPLLPTGRGGRGLAKSSAARDAEKVQAHNETFAKMDVDLTAYLDKRGDDLPSMSEVKDRLRQKYTKGNVEEFLQTRKQAGIIATHAEMVWDERQKAWRKKGSGNGGRTFCSTPARIAAYHDKTERLPL
ncbi:MAG: helicase RepA family protein [Kiritimatiellae bacterium]|nr:helicase RepA family protein [Kiritimatiellia bacterium]